MNSPLPERSATPVIRYKLLLVDDDAAVLRSTMATLEGHFDIHSCSSAEQALAALMNADFHVVCTDYRMGGMNGLELLQRVAQLPQPIGCLLVTGSTSFVGRDSEARSDHYVLLKPVEPDRLCALLLVLARTAEVKRSVARAGR